MTSAFTPQPAADTPASDQRERPVNGRRPQDRSSVTQAVAFAGQGQGWGAFGDEGRTATFSRRNAWRKVLEAAFGFQAHYLAARRAGRLVGVLPLCEVRSGFRRCGLLSLPFAIEAGVCAADY